MSNVGNRIIKEWKRPDKEMIEAFKGLPSSNVGDVMGRMFAMDYSIKPVNKPGVNLVGTAFTVRTHPADNLMVHKALDMAQPGDVIIVDACGDMGNAILGEIMCHYAKSKGIAGFIVDGSVRDLYSIAEMGFPVFAKGGSPRGPYKEGPGEINTLISCGNVAINPGDIVVADDDGVVVVPLENAVDILEKAKKKQRAEEEEIKAIYNGSLDRRWVDETLEKKGCQFI